MNGDTISAQPAETETLSARLGARPATTETARIGSPVPMAPDVAAARANRCLRAVRANISFASLAWSCYELGNYTDARLYEARAAEQQEEIDSTCFG